jgi:S-adenosylmethionine:tRNA ribosyltransferase-isomerase
VRTELLHYHLPESSIARHPPHERDGGRMLVVESGGCSDDWVRNLPERLPQGALLVVNDTRVQKARLCCQRRGTGGRVELLLLERETVDATGGEVWLALGRANGPLRPNTVVTVENFEIRIVERLQQGMLRVSVEGPSSLLAALDRIGHVPIPPYLHRPDEPSDSLRYQTVYASNMGSVAAPTAGLHLTESAMARLEQRGIGLGRVTLHVGLATFKPVEVEDLDQHPMHAETICVSPQLIEQIAATRAAGRPVVAVGTTVVRALESAARGETGGGVAPMSGTTRLLIQPGFKFQVVDALLTNFHQPESTLLALVSAFIGLSRMQDAYRLALSRGYRFLSYGDAMWIPERL